MSPRIPSEAEVSAQIRGVGAAHKSYYEKSSALLAYARVGTDPRELLRRLNATIHANEALIQSCEAWRESLGLLRGEEFPGIIDIPEEDIYVLEEEDPR